MLVFNVKLTEEELKALVVFNPKFQVQLDEFYDFNHFFNTRMSQIGGLLSFLRSDKNTPLDHPNKFEMLDYEISLMFEEEKSIKTQSFKFDTHEYTSFISCLSFIQHCCEAVKSGENFATNGYVRDFLGKEKEKLDELMEKVKC